MLEHCAECGTDLPPEASYCPGCGTEVGASGATRSEIRRLEAELQELREVVNHNGEVVDEIGARLGSSGIYNPSFWKRSWTIWGHAIVPGLIIGVGFYLLMFVVIGISVTGL